MSFGEERNEGIARKTDGKVFRRFEDCLQNDPDSVGQTNHDFDHLVRERYYIFYFYVFRFSLGDSG